MAQCLRYILAFTAVALMFSRPGDAGRVIGREELRTTVGEGQVENLVMFHGLNRNWTSPNYPENYPEGVNMTLVVEIPENAKLFMVIVKANKPSRIAGDHPCDSDYLYQSTGGLGVKYCSDISNFLYISMRSFSLQFVSSSDDKATDTGFSLTISGFDLTIKGIEETMRTMMLLI